jgi:hypothetical protein
MVLGVGATTLGILITSIPYAHATNTSSQNLMQVLVYP